MLLLPLMQSNLSSRTNLTSLNAEQREAVTSEAKRILVLAGAGSGKTKTLLQKIIYLIEEKGVSPSSILAITFTKNAANEMIDRLIAAADMTGKYEKLLSSKKIKAADKDLARLEWKKRYKWLHGLTIKTFHSFCYLVLRNHGAKEFDNRFRIIGEERSGEEDEFSKYSAAESLYDVFHKLIIKSCEDTEYLLNFKRYILDHFVDKIYIKKNTYATQDGKIFTSFNGTKVRSKSEQFIADWLYRHNIPFEYEPLLQVAEFPFHPDFHVPAANLYIEHVSNLSYAMDDKDVQYAKGGIHVVKTHEEDTKDSAFFSHKLENIFKGKLPANFNLEAKLNYEVEFKAIQDKVHEFVRLTHQVMDMMKVENVSIDSVREKAAADQHARIREFYSFAIPLIEAYNAYCTNRSFMDFNDLIIKCIDLFNHYEDIAQLYKDKYKYILVDEFQDVNNLQVDLIRQLVTDKTQLFCVGDDWQSIYGFRGSNVSYIIEFEKHFPDAEVIKLNYNYRSTEHIVSASNEVIKNNKFRVDKEIHAINRSEHKIVVYAGNDEQDNIDFCIRTVRELLEAGISGEEILFLYRRTNMFSPGAYLNKPSLSNTLYKKGLKISAKTIHSAKGLEAKVVFILGLTDGSGGFPDIWSEDRIFQAIKSIPYDLLLEEERRLFYVALTRAKEKLYLITEKGNESMFLKEIPETYTVKTHQPIKPLTETIPICTKCFSQLEKLWIVCPYCGEKTTPGSP
jgi:superfamily I DNA/RNA helicase